ncbi:MAG: hypothetical protein ACRDXB_05480, partial [Actinomycetes bacterium]
MRDIGPHPHEATSSEHPPSRGRPWPRGRRRRGVLVLVALLSASLVAAMTPATAQPQSDAGSSVTAGRPGHDGVHLTRLQVEKKTEPVGIDVDRPRFSWVVDSDARGVVQKSSRLRVATSPQALASGDLVWDSGVVRSDESANVEYRGPGLEAGTEYHWRVDVTTTAGSAHRSSHFRSGLLAEDDWAASTWIGNERSDPSLTDLTFDEASWIWTAEENPPEAPGEERAFRRVLDARAGKTPARAEILLTGDDLFRLYVNGEPLGESSGGDNEWQQGRYFTADLAADENVVAVAAENTAGSPAGLIAVVRVVYTDGTSEVLRTGDGWK